jgi:hypothetical protein
LPLAAPRSEARSVEREPPTVESPLPEEGTDPSLSSPVAVSVRPILRVE